ncbi:MAG: DUF3989 domain-containing protein [Bacteroidetes bacterium]|nr:DUF3989 domain-containing protein [Bacteroidota bacterium]
MIVKLSIIIKKLFLSFDIKIKKDCERLSPKSRLIVIITLSLVLAVSSLFIFINSLCEIYMLNNSIEIEHIYPLGL